MCVEDSKRGRMKGNHGLRTTQNKILRHSIRLP